jgi:hypothetical protein
MFTDWLRRHSNPDDLAKKVQAQRALAVAPVLDDFDVPEADDQDEPDAPEEYLD